MGVLRFRIYEAYEQGRWPDVYRLRPVHITDDTDARRLAELCAHMSATLSSRGYHVQWVMVPWFDSGADFSAVETHQLEPAQAPELPTVTISEAETAELVPRPAPPALPAPAPAPLEPPRRVIRPHRPAIESPKIKQGE